MRDSFLLSVIVLLASGGAEIMAPAALAAPPLSPRKLAASHLPNAYEVHPNGLREMATAGWRTFDKRPDAAPAHRALLLCEQLSEMLRLDDVSQRPEQFRGMLRDSAAEAKALEQALRDDKLDVATAKLERISSGCTACHREFRDKPLDEK